MDCHFRDLPDFQSSEARLMTNEWQIPKMTVHKKLLIKYKVLNQIWWSWCYYNEEEALYPARWKRIIVDQSNILKNLLFCFLWATRYMHAIKLAPKSYHQFFFWQHEKKKIWKSFQVFYAIYARPSSCQTFKAAWM